MELIRSSITESPEDNSRVRLVGEVTYDTPGEGPERYWYDVPKRHAEFLSSSGDPWLACLLPLAVTLGEPLHINQPVDRTLYENTQELMRVWKCWYSHLKIVPVEAAQAETSTSTEAQRTAAFFSGGVDSYFTILRHLPDADRAAGTSIDDLLCVWGFDIPLQNPDAFCRMRDSLQRSAAELGREFIDVATNIRSTRLRQANWGYLYHGCALASVGLIFEKRYRNVLIASTHGYKDLQPWGSHPLTDPLLSTSRTRITHDGAGFDRVEKTEWIARSEVAMRSLRVCWRSGSEANCGACNKCYRTMATLALLGALERCPAFPTGSFNVARMARVYSRVESDRSFLQEVRALARRKGDRALQIAIDLSLKRSARLNRLLFVAKGLRSRPVVGRLARSLERSMAARSFI